MTTASKGVRMAAHGDGVFSMSSVWHLYMVEAKRGNLLRFLFSFEKRNNTYLPAA